MIGFGRRSVARSAARESVSGGSRLATISLTSSGRGAPPRESSRFSSAWASRSCTSGGAASIASIRSVPPVASSRSPAASGVPKSSLPSDVEARAARFVMTKGPACRAPWACTARAARSLPLPAGPVINSGRSSAAAAAIRLYTSCIAADDPTSECGTASGSPAGSCGRRFASARATTIDTCSRSNGFTR